ncbi:methionine adenosyltransferase [Candidatus Curtissbacteria bacterium]|nr:methionine adenosyltransferase [Candidatus Curtissbacteria bacterium]MBI2594575.1 methionine adenosyltransferase [Candidatus Curtissbacteria bacterium]
MNYRLFTSESVASGHPDKICDQISDAILDACLAEDPNTHTAIETLVTVNQIILAGEVKIKDGSKIDYENIARRVVKNLGYTDEIYNFTYKSPLICLIHQQSPDIAIGVDAGGAGDQGMMFGYASNEGPEFMPLPIFLAHELVKKIDEVRKKKIIDYLRPDGKSEVKMLYEKDKPKSVEFVVLAVPHDPQITNNQLKGDLYEVIVSPVLEKYGFFCPKKNFVVNGTGKWEIGGPASDTGVTGRKIMVDTYGGMGRHGGGCFSGKEPTKVDRGGAYAARYIAKNVVAAGLADRCEVQVAYVIGRKEPLTKAIETFQTEKVDKKKIEKFAWDLLDLSVQGIVKGLNLLRPIYRETAVYGHFGRPNFPWEKIIK